MNSRGQLLLLTESTPFASQVELRCSFLFVLLAIVAKLNVITDYGVCGLGADLFPRSTATAAERWLPRHNTSCTCEKYDLAKCEEREEPKKLTESPYACLEIYCTSYELNTHIRNTDAEGSRVNRLRDFEKVDSASELGLANEDGIEEVVTPPPSSTASRAGSHSNESTASHGEPKKIIRFRDRDPDNPDNWRQVDMMHLCNIEALTDSRSRSCMHFLWLL